MRILLSGAAGFLGSNLAEKLLQDGHVVFGIDDFSTGRLENLSQLTREKNFDFFEHDIRQPLDVEVEAILNFACPASPKHYQSDPVKTIETNFLGTVNMLKLAKKYSAILVQASTSEVYGDPNISPQIEEYWGNVNPIGIRACYDEGKRAAETLCFDYFRQYGVDSRVVRIFNTYGPRMAVGDGRVVSNFIVQALRGEAMTVYGEGNQVRSLCYVSDLINGLLKLFSTDEIHEPVNLGNPEPLTMLNLAREIKEITNSSSAIVFMPLPSDDPMTREPDISRAKDLLDWEPSVNRKEGLTRTVKYFESMI